MKLILNTCRHLEKYKRFLAASLGFLLSIGIVVYLCISMNWSQFILYLRAMNLWYILVLLPLFALCILIRAIRWRYLLPTNENFALKDLSEATILGFFATMVLPLRAGEFVRPLMLSRSSKVSFPAAFASIISERVFDTIVLLLSLALSLTEIQNPPAIVLLGAKMLAVICFAILLMMIVCYIATEQILKLVNFAVNRTVTPINPTLSEKLIDAAEHLILGLKAISNLKELLLVILWSFILWGVVAFFYQVGLWSFGVSIPFLGAVALSAFIAVAVAAPSAPGFVGTFQAGCVAALSGVYGYPAELAVAYSIVMHVLQAGFFITVGIIIMQTKALRLSELKS